MKNLLKYVSIIIVTIIIIVLTFNYRNKKDVNKQKDVQKNINYNEMSNNQIDSVLKRFE